MYLFKWHELFLNLFLQIRRLVLELRLGQSLIFGIGTWKMIEILQKISLELLFCPGGASSLSTKPVTPAGATATVASIKEHQIV